MTTDKKGRRTPLFALLVLGAAVAGYIGVCSYNSHVRNAAFDAVQVGDTEVAVLALFGARPSVRERPGALFSRYASQPCLDCAERIWFENRLSFDTEAWSVELDRNRRVIRKSRWVSP